MLILAWPCCSLRSRLGYIAVRDIADHVVGKALSLLFLHFLYFLLIQLPYRVTSFSGFGNCVPKIVSTFQDSRVALLLFEVCTVRVLLPSIDILTDPDPNPDPDAVQGK